MRTGLNALPAALLRGTERLLRDGRTLRSVRHGTTAIAAKIYLLTVHLLFAVVAAASGPGRGG